MVWREVGMEALPEVDNVNEIFWWRWRAVEDVARFFSIFEQLLS